MSEYVAIADKINDIKKQLESVVIACQYDFMHPDVVKVSQKLDDLIIQMMKKPLS